MLQGMAYLAYFWIYRYFENLKILTGTKEYTSEL